MADSYAAWPLKNASVATERRKMQLAYNNGLAEGSVNKIKVVKRIMYGRNSFDLLKAKVLLCEKIRCGIN